MHEKEAASENKCEDEVQMKGEWVLLLGKKKYHFFPIPEVWSNSLCGLPGSSPEGILLYSHERHDLDEQLCKKCLKMKLRRE